MNTSSPKTRIPTALRPAVRPVLGSIQPQPLEAEEDGAIDLGKVAAAIKADDFHFAKTRLLALENTAGGKVIPLDYLGHAESLARENRLGFHLDGARVFNAAVALGVDLSDITRRFDSVSICLSKGLGAPVGSVLCANQEIIHRARRWRKMVGGGMRQVGILAAAGIYALDNNVERLQQDHDRAQRLADELTGLGRPGSGPAGKRIPTWYSFRCPVATSTRCGNTPKTTACCLASAPPRMLSGW